MDMMFVLGVLAAVFFVSLTLLCFFHDQINVKICNALFVIVDLLFYFIWNVGMYEEGWLKGSFATLDNISPMIFTVIPLTVFMKDRIKDFAFSAIAFLWVGMFLALFISPEYTYLYNYRTEASLVYTGEALCHMLASLFGIYLILTKQVKLEFSTWIKSMIFLYSIILFGVCLNVLVHKSFFGMDPYGQYSIYFMDLFGTFEATLVAYLLGIMVVLTLGMQAGYLLDRLCHPKVKEKKISGKL